MVHSIYLKGKCLNQSFKLKYACETQVKIEAQNYSCENHEEVVHENPHVMIDAERHPHEVGNVPVP